MRSAGILVHVSSLPGPHGMGEIGRDALRFLDTLQAMGVGIWQILPLNPTGDGLSPYGATSTFAGNERLIELRALREDGWLANEDFADLEVAIARKSDMAEIAALRDRLVLLAADRFNASAGTEQRADRDAFRASQSAWIETYCLFEAIRQAYPDCAWPYWPNGLAHRDEAALQDFIEGHNNQVEALVTAQYFFETQWSVLREAAHARGIRIYGDVPIFVGWHSADVWARPDLFRLNPDGSRFEISGCPPDVFNADGQLWGNPHYDWARHEAEGWDWWIRRFARAFEQTDCVRIDHFLGFSAHWTIAGDAETARVGVWEKAPGHALFTALKAALPQADYIAEDLGLVTEDVIKLRDAFGFPGMRLLQFVFGEGVPTGEEDPAQYPANSVCYTGTHDNDTTLGWYQALPEHEKHSVRVFTADDGADVVSKLVTACLQSGSDTAILPLQDVLELDGSHRMNVPGTIAGNWRWRFDWSDMDPGKLERFAWKVAASDRRPNVSPHERSAAQ